MTTRNSTDLGELAPAAWIGQIASHAVAALPALPPEATMLIAECREGVAVLAAANRFPGIRRVMAVEGDRDALNRARGVLEDIDEPPVYFASQGLPSLQFADAVFDVAMCVSGIVTTAQLFNAVSELRRVVRVGGHVLIACIDASSFPLLGALAREATWAARGHDWDASGATAARIDVDAIELAANRASARIVRSGQIASRVAFGTATSVLADTTVARDLFGAWRVLVPDSAAMLDRLPEWLDAWFGDTELVDSVDVTWVLMEVLEEDVQAIGDDDVVDESSYAEGDAGQPPSGDVLAVDDADVEVIEIVDGDVEVVEDDANG